MKSNLFLMLAFLTCSLVIAQKIELVETKGFNKNNDKFFYRIDSTSTQKGEYLGYLEVTGINDFPTNFMLISKKAKNLTGANAYEIIIDKEFSKTLIIKNIYQFRLYYIPQIDLSEENNVAYVFNESAKTLNLKINNQKIPLESGYFIKHQLEIGKTSTISSGGFLGSNIKLQEKDAQPALWFSISGFGVKPAGHNASSLGFKTGDINRIDTSYAQFLTFFQKEKTISE